jgi:hypothetical protein
MAVPTKSTHPQRETAMDSSMDSTLAPNEAQAVGAW